jgi:very-short-patch-repair endonuclease
LIPYQSKLKEPSINLRVTMTVAEKRLWEKIKGRKIKGFRFNRQKPLGAFIVDFYCRKAKLVIEVDGGIHLKEEIRREDQNKDEYFESIGLRVLRFTNEEVLTQIEYVLEKIERALP